ncbi:hypothetical protein GBA52_000610 [Prunus armeniaca]|nr:hypothetical protein GBA52_000610 [Prunus armeniaca]
MASLCNVKKPITSSKGGERECCVKGNLLDWQAQTPATFLHCHTLYPNPEENQEKEIQTESQALSFIFAGASGAAAAAAASASASAAVAEKPAKPRLCSQQNQIVLPTH